MPDIGPFFYMPMVPAGYECGTCTSRSCKLWRVGGSSHVELRCALCALREEKLTGLVVDDEGRIDDPQFGKIDQLGKYIPAVPTEDGKDWWGYTSVPWAGVMWWKSLPTYRPGERREMGADRAK